MPIEKKKIQVTINVDDSDDQLNAMPYKDSDSDEIENLIDNDFGIGLTDDIDVKTETGIPRISQLGSETEKEKNDSGKIENPRKRKTKRTKSKKIRSMLGQGKNTAGGLLRIATFLVDLFISYTVYFYFGKTEIFLKYSQMSFDLFASIGVNLSGSDLVEYVLPMVEKWVDSPEFHTVLSLMLSGLPEILFVFFVYSVLSALLFGVTVSQYIFGIRVYGNVFAIRLKAVFRMILGILLAPFIIFDLPCFFGKVTIKEKVSFSRMVESGGLSNLLRFGDGMRSASTLSRILAFIGDLGATYLVYSIWETSLELFFSDYSTIFEETLNKYVFPLLSIVLTDKTVLGVFSSNVLELVPFILFHLLYCLITAFLIGVTPFQRALGIKGHGNFLIKRIMGTIRSLIGFILGPFLIFDLPALFGKLTVKEILAFSPMVEPRRGHQQFFGIALILVPVIGIIIFPLLKDFKNAQGFSLTEKVLLEKIALPPVKDAYESSYFRIKTKPLLQKDFILIPFFKTSADGRRDVTPEMALYHRTFEISGLMKRRAGFDLFEMIDIIKNNNFLFDKSFSLTNKLRLQKKDVLKRKKHKEGEPTLIISKEGRREIREIIKASLECGINSKLPGHVFKHGPFLSPFLSLQNYLLKLVPGDGEPKFEFLRSGEIILLHGFRQQAEDALLNNNQLRRHILIPYGTVNNVSYEIAWENHKFGETAYNLFIEGFFNRAVWFLDYRRFVTFPPVDQEKYKIDTGTVLDFFSSRSLRDANRKRLETYVYNYFNELTESDLKNSFKLNKLLLKAVDSYIEITQAIIPFITAREKRNRKKFVNKMSNLYLKIQRDINESSEKSTRTKAAMD